MKMGLFSREKSANQKKLASLKDEKDEIDKKIKKVQNDIKIEKLQNKNTKLGR